MSANKIKEHRFTSSFGLLEKSYGLILDNWKLFGLLYALPAAIVISSAMAAPVKNAEPTSANILVQMLIGRGELANFISRSVVFLVSFIFISILIELMLLGLELLVAKSNKPALEEVWKLISPKIFPLFGLNLLIGLVIIAGLILLIIPGLIFLRWFLLSPFYFLDQNLSIIESMRKSKQASQKYPKELWGIIGFYLLFALPSLFSGIGLFFSFVLTAMYSVAAAIRYVEIKKAS